MARDVRMPIAGVIENMSELVCPHCDGRAALFESGGGARLATDLGVDLLGQIPLDMAVRIAGDGGEPIVITRPDSPAAAAIAGIATALRPARRVSPAVLSASRSCPTTHPRRTRRDDRWRTSKRAHQIEQASPSSNPARGDDVSS
jgi:hypothetical protein